MNSKEHRALVREQQIRVKSEFVNYQVANAPRPVWVTSDDALLANQRARDLLLTHLSDAQQAEFEANGWFRVRGSNGGMYRVTDKLNKHGTHTFNVVVEASPTKPRGMQLCAICRESLRDPVPQDDVLLAQKLAIEADAHSFERIAHAKLPADITSEWGGNFHPQILLEDENGE